MTGSVPEGLLSRPFSRADYGEVPFGTDGCDDGPTDDGSVEERLSNLGYV